MVRFLPSIGEVSYWDGGDQRIERLFCITAVAYWGVHAKWRNVTVGAPVTNRIKDILMSYNVKFKQFKAL